MRLLLANLQKQASSMGLILERHGREYELTDDSQGTTYVCENLKEVHSELMNQILLNCERRGL